MEQLGQRVDINLRHLQSLIFGEFLVVVQSRNNAAQLVKRVVEAVHPPPLSGVGRDASLFLDPVYGFAGRGSLSSGCLLFRPGDSAFEAAQVPDFERGRGGSLGRLSVAGRAGMTRGPRGATL